MVTRSPARCRRWFLILRSRNRYEPDIIPSLHVAPVGRHTGSFQCFADSSRSLFADVAGLAAERDLKENPFWFHDHSAVTLPAWDMHLDVLGIVRHLDGATSRGRARLDRLVPIHSPAQRIGQSLERMLIVLVPDNQSLAAVGDHPVKRHLHALQKCFGAVSPRRAGRTEMTIVRRPGHLKPHTSVFYMNSALVGPGGNRDHRDIRTRHTPLVKTNTNCAPVPRSDASRAPRAQFLETADTLAGAAGLGPSLVRRPPYCDPLPVPSPRPTDVLPPGRAIYLVR